jgi:hypothetical protein
MNGGFKILARLFRPNDRLMKTSAGMFPGFSGKFQHLSAGITNKSNRKELT